MNQPATTCTFTINPMEIYIRNLQRGDKISFRTGRGIRTGTFLGYPPLDSPKNGFFIMVKHDNAKMMPVRWLDLAKLLRACKICACTDTTACNDDGIGCSWVNINICSSCRTRGRK